MICPSHPPFPVPSNFPFQLDAGSQTSNLISESLVGRDVAVTRQNGGRVLKSTEGRMGIPEGGANVPAGTSSASVIVVSANLRFASFEHSSPVDGVVATRHRKDTNHKCTDQKLIFPPRRTRASALQPRQASARARDYGFSVIVFASLTSPVRSSFADESPTSTLYVPAGAVHIPLLASK